LPVFRFSLFTFLKNISHGTRFSVLSFLNFKKLTGLELNTVLDNDISNYTFYKIETIYRGREQVYDLHVPKSHTFMANGIVNHNTSLARIFSRALICESGGVDPCNTCKSCQDHLKDLSISYKEFDAGSDGQVENIRKLKNEIYYRQHKWKVIVLDEAHRASDAAQTSLLKLLEASLDNVVFIFVTTEISKLHRTILSRSFEIPFREVDYAEIGIHLNKIGVAEGLQLDKDVYDFIAMKSDGHVRDAVKNLEMCYLTYGLQFSLEQAQSILGVDNTLVILKFLNGLLNTGNFQEVFTEFIQEINPYTMSMSVFGVICDLIHVFYGGRHVTNPGLMPQYTDFVTRYGENIFSLAELLNNPIFIKFKDYKSLYMFCLWVQYRVKKFAFVPKKKNTKEDELQIIRNRARQK